MTEKNQDNKMQSSIAEAKKSPAIDKEVALLKNGLISTITPKKSSYSDTDLNINFLKNRQR